MQIEAKVGRYNAYELFAREGDVVFDSEVVVYQPLARRSYYHDRPYDPTHEDPQYSDIHVSTTYGTMPSHEALALAELLAVAAELCHALNIKAAAQLEDQARAREAHLSAEIKEKEKRQAKQTKLKEELGWYLGHRFKIKVRGRRSETFGTLTGVSSYGITATARGSGEHLSVSFSEIDQFLVKMDDDEPRYTPVL